MISLRPMLSLKGMRAPAMTTRRSAQKMWVPLLLMSSYGDQMHSARKRSAWMARTATVCVQPELRANPTKSAVTNGATTSSTRPNHQPRPFHQLRRLAVARRLRTLYAFQSGLYGASPLARNRPRSCVSTSRRSALRRARFGSGLGVIGGDDGVGPKGKARMGGASNVVGSSIEPYEGRKERRARRKKRKARNRMAAVVKTVVKTDRTMGAQDCERKHKGQLGVRARAGRRERDERTSAEPIVHWKNDSRRSGYQATRSCVCRSDESAGPPPRRRGRGRGKVDALVGTCSRARPS